MGAQTVKRMAPLLVSVGLLLGVGAIGLTTSTGANRRAQTVHREDRLFLQEQLGSLSNQFFLLTFKEEFDYASSGEWSLRSDDPGDLERLKAFVSKSALLTHGAALVGLDRQILSSYAKPPGLPSLRDVGFLPLLSGLLSSDPGLSSVMDVDGVPVVALGVPVMDGMRPRALFLGFFRADLNPLQEYSQRLRYGRTGLGYVVDSRGVIAAATEVEKVGGAIEASPAIGAIAARRSGFREFERDGVGMVVSFAPIGVGGWGTITEQTADEFFGPIRSGGLRVNIALFAVLIVAAAALAVLNHKRQVALRRAYDYKGALLANTTHELKTPLTAIHGAAMTLGTRWRTMKPEQIDLFLSMIHRRCGGLSKLIEKILQGARLEAGRETVLRPEPLEVGVVLHSVRADFEDASSEHMINVAVPNGDLWARADAQALDQVLGLLVENAIKYSPDGGEVLLEAEERTADVVVRVADPGIGMSEEDAQHVFEPYYRAQRGDRNRFAGVGLGLAIARHLVRRMGGEIWVASTLGVGSVFSFTVPKAEPPARQEEPVMIELGT